MSRPLADIASLPQPTISGTLGRNLAIVSLVLFLLSLIALVPPVLEARDLQTQTAAMADQLANAKEEIAQLQARRAVAETERADVDQTLTTRRVELAAVTRDLQLAREGLDEAKRVKQEADTAVRNARDAANSEASVILERAKSEAELSDKKRKAAEERVTALEALERNLNATIASAEPQAAAAQRRLEELRKLEADLFVTVGALQKQYSDLAKQTDGALTLRGEVQSLSSEKERLTKQVSEAQRQLSESQARADGIKADESRAAYLRNEIQSQQSKLSDLQIAIGAAEERKSAALRESAEVASLTSRKSQLETELLGLRAEEGRLSAIEASRVEAEAKLAQLRTELGTLDVRVAAGRVDVQAVESLRSQKSTLESDVARLRADVAQLEERASNLTRTNAQVDAAAQSAEKLKVTYEALLKVLNEIHARLSSSPNQPVVKPEEKQGGGS